MSAVTNASQAPKQKPPVASPLPATSVPPTPSAQSEFDPLNPLGVAGDTMWRRTSWSTVIFALIPFVTNWFWAAQFGSRLVSRPSPSGSERGRSSSKRH